MTAHFSMQIWFPHFDCMQMSHCHKVQQHHRCHHRTPIPSNLIGILLLNWNICVFRILHTYCKFTNWWRCLIFLKMNTFIWVRFILHASQWFPMYIFCKISINYVSIACAYSVRVVNKCVYSKWKLRKMLSILTIFMSEIRIALCAAFRTTNFYADHSKQISQSVCDKFMTGGALKWYHQCLWAKVAAIYVRALNFRQ